MKRFKNIVMVYDLVPGCDETLARAEGLAVRNPRRTLRSSTPSIRLQS